jgi:hypothetical protein
MKTSLRSVVGLLVVAVTALSVPACSSPTPASQPDVRSYWDPQPEELFPSYSYKRVGGG